MRKNNRMNTKLIIKRKKLGFTQESLANAVNVSRSLIAKWECGETKPSVEDLKKLCEVLDTKPRKIGYPNKKIQAIILTSVLTSLVLVGASTPIAIFFSNHRIVDGSIATRLNQYHAIYKYSNELNANIFEMNDGEIAYASQLESYKFVDKNNNPILFSDIEYGDRAVIFAEGFGLTAPITFFGVDHIQIFK